MADALLTQGKIYAMQGLEAKTNRIQLKEKTTGVTLSTAEITDTSGTFDIDGAGQMSNAVAIDFTIGSSDVGKTVDKITLAYYDGATTEILADVDLETELLLQTEGTATFAVGDLTVDL